MSVNGEKSSLATADVDFECIGQDCSGVLKFNLMDASMPGFQCICPLCHKSYAFEEMLRDKLHRLCEMIVAIRKAEDILGDCNVAVTVPGKTVKIPYALLLTRLNTMISFELGGKKVDFHFRVEPASPETFR